MTITAMPRRRLWRRIAIGLATVLAVLVLAVAIRLGPVFLAPNAYAGVTSIEASATYRQPAGMAAAWALPVARLYHRQPFEYQANPSFCGPTSLANVVHSLGRPTSQTSIIAGTREAPWFGYLIPGMTIDALADLAQTRLGRPVAVLRDLPLSNFRAELVRANDPRWRYIVNFDRGPLFGRGHGHFSPVLGYLADRDLVLVGDVNAKYRPFLVSSQRLWQAANTLDRETGQDRGLLRIDIGPGSGAALQSSLLQ